MGKRLKINIYKIKIRENKGKKAAMGNERYRGGEQQCSGFERKKKIYRYAYSSEYRVNKLKMIILTFFSLVTTTILMSI